MCNFLTYLSDWCLGSLTFWNWFFTAHVILPFIWYAAILAVIASYSFISLRTRQIGHHFPNNIFKGIFLNENVWISIEISLKCVPKGPINNIPALVQIMAGHQPGDKPLSELIMVSLLMHICITWPQWVILAFSIFIHCVIPFCLFLPTVTFHLNIAILLFRMMHLYILP